MGSKQAASQENVIYDTVAETAAIVAAHVSNNHVDADDLPTLIHDVHRALLESGMRPAPLETSRVPDAPSDPQAAEAPIVSEPTPQPVYQIDTQTGPDHKAQAMARPTRGQRPPTHAQPVPAVPVEESVTLEAIYSLEDGRPYKDLARHLMASYGMTPDDYRAKWGLPGSYPMLPPDAVRRRGELVRVDPATLEPAE